MTLNVKSSFIRLVKPEPGQVARFPYYAGTERVYLGFDPNSATISKNGANLEFIFVDGCQIILEGCYGNNRAPVVIPDLDGKASAEAAKQEAAPLSRNAEAHDMTPMSITLAADFANDFGEEDFFLIALPPEAFPGDGFEAVTLASLRTMGSPLAGHVYKVPADTYGQADIIVHLPEGHDGSGITYQAGARQPGAAREYTLSAVGEVDPSMMSGLSGNLVGTGSDSLEDLFIQTYGNKFPLFGKSSNDAIYGGWKEETPYGDTATDAFVWTKDDMPGKDGKFTDVVRDFNAQRDVIDLSELDLDPEALRYDVNGDDVRIDFSVNGGIQSIVIENLMNSLEGERASVEDVVSSLIRSDRIKLSKK